MTIEPAAPLEVFKKHLNKTGTDDDDELTRTLVAATSIAENDPEVGIGPIVQREVTARATFTSSSAVLPVGPVVTIASLTGTGRSVGADYTADGITFDDDGTLTGLAVANGSYLVTYTAGWSDAAANVPEDIQLAVCIIGKHLWETQRGRASNRAGNAVEGEQRTPAGYLIPHRAAAILRGRRPWGPAFA